MNSKTPFFIKGGKVRGLEKILRGFL